MLNYKAEKCICNILLFTTISRKNSLLWITLMEVLSSSLKQSIAVTGSRNENAAHRRPLSIFPNEGSNWVLLTQPVKTESGPP